jgi:short chain dehydrogenase
MAWQSPLVKVPAVDGHSSHGGSSSPPLFFEQLSCQLSVRQPPERSLEPLSVARHERSPRSAHTRTSNAAFAHVADRQRFLHLKDESVRPFASWSREPHSSPEGACESANRGRALRAPPISWHPPDQMATNGVLLVTGGARGIGAAVSRLAGRRGYQVAVNYRTRASAADAVVREIEELGGRAVAIGADVSRETEVERLFKETERHLGPLTGVVSNAGITGRASRIDEVDAETLQRVLDVNIALRARSGATSFNTMGWPRGRYRPRLLGGRNARQPQRMGLVCRVQSRRGHAHSRTRPGGGARRHSRQRGCTRTCRHRDARQLRN